MCYCCRCRCRGYVQPALLSTPGQVSTAAPAVVLGFVAFFPARSRCLALNPRQKRTTLISIMSFVYYALLRVLPFVFALLLLLLLPLFFAPCVSFHNIAYRRCCCCWHRCCSPTYSTFNAQIQEEKKLIISRYVFAQYEYNTTNMFLPFMLMIGALTETYLSLFAVPVILLSKTEVETCQHFFLLHSLCLNTECMGCCCHCYYCRCHGQFLSRNF